MKPRNIAVMLARLVGACACLGLCSTAGAGERCAQWRMPSDWTIYQDNGYRLFFAVEGDQNHGFRGRVEGHRGSGLRGLFEGHANPEKLVLEIHWFNGAVGGYEGAISHQGRVEGFTYDKNVKGSTANFRAERLLRCAEWVATAPASPPQKEEKGPVAKPDATKGQQESSSSGSVLVPEPSSGPSPFGSKQAPFETMKDIGVVAPPSGIKPAPRTGTYPGDDDEPH